MLSKFGSCRLLLFIRTSYPKFGYGCAGFLLSKIWITSSEKKTIAFLSDSFSLSKIWIIFTCNMFLGNVFSKIWIWLCRISFSQNLDNQINLTSSKAKTIATLSDSFSLSKIWIINNCKHVSLKHLIQLLDMAVQNSFYLK